jgi:hypothetical protein
MRLGGYNEAKAARSPQPAGRDFACKTGHELVEALYRSA